MKNITIKDIICYRIAKEHDKKTSYELIDVSIIMLSKKYRDVKNIFLLKHAEKFFKDKNVLANLIRNIGNSLNKRVKSLREAVFKYNINVQSLIIGGFSWMKSPEGDNFWRKIHKEYSIFLEKILEKSIVNFP